MAERRVLRGRGFGTAVAFTFGACLGSVIALLYAPASGKVTRRRLGLRMRTLQRQAVRQLSQTGRVLATKAEGVREAAQGWIADHLPRNGRQHPRRVIRHATAR